MNILSGGELVFYLMAHGDGQTSGDMSTIGHAYFAGKLNQAGLNVQIFDAGMRLMTIIMKADAQTKPKLIEDMKSLIA